MSITKTKLPSLQIDRDNLHEELMAQAFNYCEVAEECARAVSNRDDWKERVSVAKAEAYLRIRTAADNDGLKVTEASLAAQIELDPTYREAVENYQLWKLTVGELEAARDAWDQRGRMLKELASLWIAGYYGQNSVKGGDADDLVVTNVKRRLAEKRRKLNE